MNIVKDGVPCINIVAEETPVSMFASEELQKYLVKRLKCFIPVFNCPEEDKPSIFVGRLEWCKDKANFSLNEDDLKYDGYCIKSFKNDIFLTSKIDRGVLFAVYAFLERIGYRWYFPGDKGEIIPVISNICMDDISEISNPDFEIRSFTEGSHKKPVNLWKNEMFEAIDWCCKNKINSIYIHQRINENLEEIEPIKCEIIKRGLIFEYGGHGTQNFINRDLFEQKPYLFREKEGLRRKDGNFCGSNDEAISIIVKSVEEVLKKNGGIDILHLFFDDVFEGSWCDCELCKSISAPDQLMNVINKVYSEISKKYPAIIGDIVLYHDSLEVEKITLSPHPNVVGYYAPRERCYAHRIGDSSCERNMEYFAKLKGVIEKFGDNVYVFEYYADMILYTKMKVHIPRVIANDLTDYKNAGVNKITALMFLRYSWWAYAFNMYLFARTTWNLDYDHIKGLNEFCKELYINNYKTMIEYYTLFEKASYGILSFCEYKYNESLLDLRDIPPQSLEFYKKHVEQIKESLSILEECAHLLKGLLETSTGNEKILLMDENKILDITVKEAEAIYFQMLGRYLYNLGKISFDIFKSYMDKAIYCKTEIKQIIETVSDEVKGSCGIEIFTGHLCNDQIGFLEKLKKEPGARC